MSRAAEWGHVTFQCMSCLEVSVLNLESPFQKAFDVLPECPMCGAELEDNICEPVSGVFLMADPANP